MHPGGRLLTRRWPSDPYRRTEITTPRDDLVLETPARRTDVGGVESPRSACPRCEFALPATAQNLQKGIAAFNSRDYAAARKELATDGKGRQLLYFDDREPLLIEKNIGEASLPAVNPCDD